jgi:hypothetical protein
MTKIWFFAFPALLLGHAAFPVDAHGSDTTAQITELAPGIPDGGRAKVVEIADFDHITIEVESKRVVVALARVLPLSAWPAKNITGGRV